MDMTPQARPRREWRRLLLQFAIAASYAMACLTALGLLALLLAAGTSLFHTPCFPPVERARLDLRNIDHALRLYWAKTGRYPTTSEGLRALVTLQALEALPRDPWGAEYRYVLWNGTPRVWTLGADGAPGGEGADTDLTHLELRPGQHR